MSGEMSSPTPSSSFSTHLLRRRNGRQQACEPCRRRKVSCGHEVPVCSRCKKRGTASKCEYLIQGRPASFGLISPTPTTTAEPRGLTLDSALAGTQAQQQPIRHVSTGVKSTQSPPTDMNHGYLGPTSFSAVFHDTQSSLAHGRANVVPSISTSASGHTGIDSASALSPSPGSPVDTDSRLPDLGPATSDTAVIDLLRQIPDKETAEALFRRRITTNEWFRPAVERLMSSLYGSFGPLLARQDATAELHDLARLLTKNSSRPFREFVEEPHEWMETFTGLNMRWEGLALLFVIWGFGSIASGGQEVGQGLRSVWIHEKHCFRRARKYADCALASLARAKVPRNANTLLLYSYLCTQLLESSIVGDASLEVWMIHAQTVGIATFMGIHAESPISTYTPTAASEGRRRVFAMVFNCDKVLATFTGRPPLLSRRHVTTPLFLHVSDQTLLAGRKAIDEAVSKLDENGWRSDGEPRSQAVLRARNKIAYIRDAILEIALGDWQNTPVEDILALKRKQLDEHAQFPAVFQVDTSPSSLKALILSSQADPPSPRKCRGDGVQQSLEQDLDPLVPLGFSPLARLKVQLEHLQNMFFIERLLAKKNRWGGGLNGVTGSALPYGPFRSRPPDDLLLVSFDMLVVTLVFWTHRDLFSARSQEEWLVMAYGAPAGGVLCMELMAGPHRDDRDGPRQTNPSGPSERKRPSRSAIVQQLSRLVAFLDGVGPTAPNGDLCQTVKSNIQHVLDQTLNANVSVQQQQQQQQQQQEQQSGYNGEDTQAVSAMGLRTAGDEAGIASTTAGDLSGVADGVAVCPTDMLLENFPWHGEWGDIQFFNFDLLDTFDWLRPETGMEGHEAA
ncbi:hypothetical protein VTK73DRAFT_8016 [Phialemonium thermophilum]|uniref:Zn(2)-C6 fungal-type domain-containing protein n=1 Tax=Phialemonium thermophilum TaxID=223376 RepID=A0ABR3XQ58_9PEZI